MDPEEALEIIKEVSKENDYETHEVGERAVEVYFEKKHSAAFKVIINKSDYLQVHSWEDDEDDSGDYGRAIYSIRNYTDLIRFCSILISGSEIRAKRRE